MSKKSRTTQPAAGDQAGASREANTRLVFVNSEPWAGANFSCKPGDRLVIGPPEQQGAQITEETAYIREEAGLGKVVVEDIEEPEGDEADAGAPKEE